MGTGTNPNDTDQFVEHHSRRMMSFAMYRKLKSVVDSWDREERAKAKIVTRAVLGLLAWLGALILGAFYFPKYSGLVVPIGFLAWVVFVVGLIWKHLGAPRRD
jgi:hypothetical protein